MNTIFIRVALIVYANIYGLLLKVLNVKASILNAVIYMMIGFLIAGILFYINYNRTTIGAVVVIILGAIGSLIRVATKIKNIH